MDGGRLRSVTRRRNASDDASLFGVHVGRWISVPAGPSRPLPLIVKPEKALALYTPPPPVRNWMLPALKEAISMGCVHAETRDFAPCTWHALYREFTNVIVSEAFGALGMGPTMRQLALARRRD